MELTIEQINQIIEEIELPENLDRKRASLKSAEIYDGKLKKYVQRKISQMYPKSWDLYTISDYSILKKIVDKKSKAYKEAVIRKLSTPDESTAYQDICKEFTLNEAMKTLDIDYNQFKYGLFGCTMDLDEDGKPKFNFMSLKPQEFDVVKDSSGEAKIVIISYPTRTMTTVSDTDGMDSLIAGSKSDEGIETKIYTFWTETNFYIVEQVMNNGKAMGPAEIKPIPNNTMNVNPWGKLPFVYLPMNDGPDYPAPSPLPDQTIELNALLSVYLTSGNMQVGQLVIKHPQDQKIEQAASGMMTLLKLPQSNAPDAAPTDAQYISPNPNMDGHRTSIMTFASLIMDEQGIRPGTGITSQAEKFTSGLDRAISEADVQDIIETNQQLYARVEEEIYEIIKAQLASIGQNPFSSDDLQVIYKKPKLMVSDTEVLSNLKMMMDLGLLEDWEKFVVVDPNLSEQDAKEKLARIKASKTKAPAEPAQPVDPVGMTTAEHNQMMGDMHANNSGPSNEGN
jgi:hypothetical protein